MSAPDAMLSNEQPSTTAPRKRRRRAPATGATDDCFACQKRQVECDRRRPYCTPCLDLGKDCSGYRTTLTWGVGVASRGKLRGMSLPVIKPGSKPAKHTSPTVSRHVLPAVVGATQLEACATRSSGSQAARQRANSLKSGSSISAYESSALEAARSMQHLSGSTGQHPWSWATTPTALKREHSGNMDGIDTVQPTESYGRHRLQLDSNNANGVLLSPTLSFPTPTHSDDTKRYPNTETVMFPPTPIDVPFIDPFLSHCGMSRRQYSDHPQGHVSSYSQTQHGQYYDAMSVQCLVSSVEYTTSPTMTSINQQMHISGGFEREAESVEQVMKMEVQKSSGIHEAEGEIQEALPVYDEEVTRQEPQPYPNHGQEPYELEMMLTLPTTISERQTCPLSLRTQHLLDYYDKAICPVLVAFDGPTNPYRTHIMRLVVESPELQNAIGALTTNNMRNRGLTDVPPLAIKSGQEGDVLARMAAVIGSATPEEQHYKHMSIELLNRQLVDPFKAREDSILATLLILCLFHVCDSGFSKFKTQLAGVQKLLRMRGKTPSSTFLDWVEMFFSWFDVMTSCVNDRETQIRSTKVDLMDISSSMGALEEFSGCDGRLFKIIARLSRLNLLSQSRAVRDVTPGATPRASSPSAMTGGADAMASDHHGLQYEHLEGSRWADPMVDYSTIAMAPDNRHAFWREWNEIRQRLQEWELDHLYGSLACSGMMPGPQSDLCHISESFRYSALLYTERLAYPHLPPSSSNFQNLVSQALYHIDQIGLNSCVLKFLLWPLFITGSECVQEHHRDMIRNRCLEIQRESGFYNNLSSLAVLERLWRDGEAGGAHARTKCGAQPFRWRKAMMDRVDGEYIVV